MGNIEIIIYGIGKRLTQILKDIGERSKAAIKIGKDLREWFTTKVGTRQGDRVSSNTCIFITYLERILDKIQDNGTAISVRGIKINNLRFADGIDLIEESCETLQDSVRVLNDAGNRAGLKINIGKTKTMVFGREEMANEINVGDQKVENVKEFVYLGSLLTWDNDCTK